MDVNLTDPKKDIPAPPAPEVSIRTMSSDIKALEQGGGEIAAPQISSAPQAAKSKFEIEGYSGPEKSIFSPMPGIAPKQEGTELNGKKSGWVEILTIAVVIIIAVAAIGFLGYFIFSRWIFPPQMPAA